MSLAKQTSEPNEFCNAEIAARECPVKTADSRPLRAGQATR